MIGVLALLLLAIPAVSSAFAAPNVISDDLRVHIPVVVNPDYGVVKIEAVGEGEEFLPEETQQTFTNEGGFFNPNFAGAVPGSKYYYKIYQIPGNDPYTTYDDTIYNCMVEIFTDEGRDYAVTVLYIDGETEKPDEKIPDENGSYTSKDDVALYIHVYGKLPNNFITKKEAEKLGWSGGSLENVAPGKSIGGSYFGNYEGLLPEKKGRTYTECDIDTAGRSSRGAKRIVFSNDGLIYYTDDHYETFTLLYGEEILKKEGN